jgi:hypothetical protein
MISRTLQIHQLGSILFISSVVVTISSLKFFNRIRSKAIYNNNKIDTIDKVKNIITQSTSNEIEKTEELSVNFISENDNINTNKYYYLNTDSKNTSWYQFKSIDIINAEKCEIKFINNLSFPIIMCWVGFDGTLYHYRHINDCSINDGSVRNDICEYTMIHHAFVCYRLNSDKPKHISDVLSQVINYMYILYQIILYCFIALYKMSL